jgi:YidC/Oxa1 family membrane protein insertase
MSFIGAIFRPIFEVLAGLIAFYFGLVHSYALAIALLTVTVMIFLSPLTIISTRSMLQMQSLQPKIKELQKKFGKDRQGMAQAQQALFKENKVSPASGCLPMLLQFPLLIVMYDVIRGLATTVGAHHIPSPKYIGHTTLLYKDLVASGGVMHSLGIDLSVSATSHKGPFIDAIPYFLMVVLAVGLQFLQSWQITSKNPSAAKANPSALMIQRYTPLIFGVIYIGIPSGVNLYFIVSGLFRVIQQEVMWRHDPVLRAHSQGAKEAKLLSEKAGLDTPAPEDWVSKVKPAALPTSKPAPVKSNGSGGRSSNGAKDSPKRPNGGASRVNPRSANSAGRPGSAKAGPTRRRNSPS